MDASGNTMPRMPAQLDITEPQFAVQVEIDERRHVLYVHVDGYTALRICRIPGEIEVVVHEEEKHPDRYPDRDTGIVCREHGEQGLSHEEYMAQLYRSDSPWLCPIGGRMCDHVYWDDDRYERHHTDKEGE